MAQKLSILLAAVAVLAFAIPTMASAAEAKCGSSVCAVGTKITGTGKEVTLKSSTLGNTTCATLNVNGAVTRNSGGVVEGSGETLSPTQSGCNLGPERPFTVTSFNIVNLTAAESTGPAGATKNATMAFTTSWDFPSGVTCKFPGSSVKGTYVSGKEVLSFSQATGITSTGGCGTAKLSGSFTLEQTAGGTFHIN